MRILRSQYLKLKTNAEGLSLAENSKIIGKRLPSKSQQIVNKEHQLPATTSTKAALPTRSLQTARQDYFHSTSSVSCNGTNIKILFDEVDESFDKLKVVVEFTDMDAMWLTRVYQTYENELWHKKPRSHGNDRKRRWNFFCHLCGNRYRRFYTIKNHLNLHMKLYPYVCKLCSMKYTGRGSATRHLTNVHRLTKEYWNDYLTS